jgi:hypothetical protein
MMQLGLFCSFYKSNMMRDEIKKGVVFVCTLYVTVLHFLYAYIQIDSGSEKSNIIDHPPTLQRNPPVPSSVKENKSIIMTFSL